jgi:uncharacterized protein
MTGREPTSHAGASDRVRVRRNPKKGRYDAETIGSILDRAIVCCVAFVDRGEPICLPTLCARVGERIYIHGSSASRALRALSRGGPACLTVTSLQGLVLARSAFEHTVNYESVVAFGRFQPIVDPEERLKTLRAFTEKLLPGRWDEVRPPSGQELKATMTLAMTIDEASAKVRSGPPDDDETRDAERDTWAGEIPISTTYGPPIPSPGLRPEIPLAASAHRLLADEDSAASFERD